MLISAKVFFQNNMQDNINTVVSAKTQIPEEFVKRYRKNVRKITPMKPSHGWLRKSIISQVQPGRADISWRAEYASAQNQGWHKTKSGKIAIYRKYSTGGTGPKFAQIAFERTMSEMPAVYREMGLTK